MMSAGRDAKRTFPGGASPASPPLPQGWRDAGGVLISPAAVPGDPRYPDDLREWLAEAEPTHFWFRARARLIGRTVRARVDVGGWLELGCGTGFVLAEVARRHGGPCHGQEVSRRALEIARRRTSAALYLCPMDGVPVGELAGVGLFDVLEHLPDDAGTLAIASRYLRRGGAMVLTVPAHPWLWSQVDVAAGHRRRYRRDALASLLESAGLRVEFCRPFFTSLLPGVLLRRIARRRGADTVLRTFLRPPPGPVNAALRGIAEVEGLFCRMGLTALGTSLLAVGRKR